MHFITICLFLHSKFLILITIFIFKCQQTMMKMILVAENYHVKELTEIKLFHKTHPFPPSIFLKGKTVCQHMAKNY